MRPIDADALYERAYRLNLDYIVSDVELRMIKTLLDLAPTIKERKKGKWIGKPIAGYCTVRCSVCKDVFSENNGRWNFCPTCGADNRGETNDAEDIH